MLTTDFEQRLFNKLGHALTSYGFDMLSEKRQLRRQIGGGDFEHITFSVSPYENDFWIEVIFGIRKQQVEEMVQQFLTTGYDYQRETTTWHTSIGKFKGLKYFRYKVKDNINFTKTTDDIIEFFLKSGLPFMYGHRALTDIHGLLNAEPERDSRFIHNQVHRCFKGIAVAKLIDSPELHNLIDTYRFIVIKYGNGEEVERFEQFISYMLYYNPN